MRTDEALQQMPDTEVMLQVQWGSEPAFAEVYRRYYRRLLDFFYGMSVSASGSGRGDAQVAEDLCHETFLRLWRLRVRYRASGSFAAYLFTIARHIWQERRRQLRKEWRLKMVHPADGIENALVAAQDATPDELSHRAEVTERIHSALARLPDEQRMAFVLRTIEGLSLGDIAEVMKCPVNTVRSRRLLAVKQLRKVLRGLFVV